MLTSDVGQAEANRDDLDFVGYRGIALHPYPATMPHPVAAELIARYSRAGDHVLDPFAGSGTTLRAAADSGRASTGIELNPLAALIARVAVSRFDPSEDIARYQSETRAVLHAVSDEAAVPNDRWSRRTERWFLPEIRDDLARLAAAIRTRKRDAKPYDFLLLAFSRTVRATSLARPGELKLWKRTVISKADVFSVFFREANDLTWRLADTNLQANSCSLQVRVFTGDAVDLLPQVPRADAIVTSPPYGDSWTTVAYGNFSLLSRIWLSAIESSYAETDPASEDARSLGGASRSRGQFDIAELRARSPALDAALPLIENVSPPRAGELATFLFDLHEVLVLAANRVAEGGHLVMVIGPRRVAGVPVDTGVMISELLRDDGLTHVDRFGRRITGKRLPTRSAQGDTGVAETINHETVDVLRVTA